MRGHEAPPESVDDGRYQLGHLLGEGGMAQVFRAHDTELDIDRAVKLLHSHASKGLRQRLRNEARAMARLRHPHILGIHDVGQQDGLDWIVMDLALGGSLQDKVAREGPLPMGDAIGFVLKVLAALASAHAAGIVHRDVKPHNVLLDEHGDPLLADFGIAMLSESDRSTRTGVAMGSLAFMPPEQRLDAAHVGPTADIYATGCTLFALLTNDNPVDLFLARADSERWKGVPEPIRDVVQTACAPHPSDRYATAKEMADALLEVLDTFDPEERQRALMGRGFFPPPSKSFSPRSTPGAAPAASAPPATLAHPPTLGHAPTQAEPTVAAPTPSSRLPWVAAALVLLLLVPSGWWLFASARVIAPPSTTPTSMEPKPAAPEPEAAAPAPRPELPEPEPEPEPVVAPAPAPAPAVVPPPEPPRPRAPATAASSEPVVGSWQGSANGRQVSLDLTGPADALRGTFVVSWGGKEDRSSVRGRFRADQRVVLRDAEPRNGSGTYELTLDGDRLEGVFVRDAGGRVPVKLYRPGNGG